MKVCQYLRLHMKMIYWIFQIKTPFTFWDMRTWDMWKVCFQTFRNKRICQKLACFLKNLQTSRVNNSIILTINSAELSGYCLKVIKNTLLDKLENPESLKKIATVRELFNKCSHSLPGFAEGILQVVLFTVSWFKWSKKNCVAKVLLIIWEIFLHGNNCNYHSYGFSYKFVFILFLSFLTNQKQELGFQ